MTRRRASPTRVIRRTATIPLRRPPLSEMHRSPDPAAAPATLERSNDNRRRRLRRDLERFSPACPATSSTCRTIVRLDAARAVVATTFDRRRADLANLRNTKTSDDQHKGLRPTTAPVLLPERLGVPKATRDPAAGVTKAIESEPLAAITRSNPQKFARRQQRGR